MVDIDIFLNLCLVPQCRLQCKSINCVRDAERYYRFVIYFLVWYFTTMWVMDVDRLFLYYQFNHDLKHCLVTTYI